MRYFIVTGVIKNLPFHQDTKFHLAIKHNYYPSMQDIDNEVHKNGVIISNIIELNKDDYESFLGKGKKI